ncbi:MAG: chemotaxis protein CheW [Clostridiales bacterium]|nr:chemotaxis protein CheW [Clostridiales bacterium]
MKKTNKYVVFKLKEEYYGIPISYVKTLEKTTDITRVPNADNYVKGVMNLRGEVVPVIDLRLRFGFEKKEEDEDARTIVLEIDDIVIGLNVDSSSEVLTIDDEDIDSAAKFTNSFEDDFIKGIGKFDDRMIIIIDTHKLVNTCHKEN